MTDFSRRDFLRAGGVASAGVGGYFLVGCSALSTKADKKKDNGAAGSGYKGKEAPMLADLVKQKKLPPLEQRLPEKPAVFEPLTKSGVYGGTSRMAQINIGATIPGSYARQGFAEWDIMGKQAVPAVAESWDITEEGKLYTFHMRKGLKWSDGHPFTADDLMYVYEKVISNKTLTPAVSSWLTAGGQPVKIEKVDDHTVNFRFVAPHGLLLKYLAFPGISWWIMAPKHYMSKFHPDFVAKDELKAMIKKAKLHTWDELYNQQNDIGLNPDRPTLGAWKMTKVPGTSGKHSEAERNPYYWKVDPDGRQLPYIDKLSWDFLSAEALGLRAANGELDSQYTDIGFDQVTLLVKNSKRGNYHVNRWVPDNGVIPLYINQSHKDPVIRKLFQSLDFRAGLSHAIDRKEINESLLADQGTYMQPCGQPEDTYWVEGFGQRFIEHDVAEANRRLDSAGLSARGGNNMRLRPDGKEMVLRVLTFPLAGNLNIEVFEFVKRHWAKVGIHMEIQNVSQNAFYNKAPNGDFDINGYGGIAGYHWDVDPLWYVPADQLSYWCPLFGKWYQTGGQEGEKPTGIYREMQTTYDQLRAETDEKKRLALGQKILRVHDENVFIIGTVRMPFQPYVCSNDLINVRKDAVASFRTGLDESTALEQAFFTNPADH